ncbi:MAG: NAD-dependent epimerase/dehydratase family protein [Ilumatobacteraceae bacterium]|jgi:UDP-glucose 4-epimerase
MQVLVMGGAGFIGSHLTERLLAEGHSVEVVDDLSSGSLANLAEARSMNADLKFHTLDVCTDGFMALAALRPPDVVYNLTLLPPSRHAEGVAGASLRSVAAALEVGRARPGTKVVVAVSAAALYGEVPAREQPLKESQPWKPLGVAGVVARSAIDLLAAYRERHAVEFTALAMPSVYGPRQRPDAGVVAAFADAARRGVAPVVHGDGRQTRDFLFVDDAVDALMRAARKGSGLVVNTGTGVSTSIIDLWRMMSGSDGADPEFAPRRTDSVQRLALAPTRARIQLAWAPWTDLATGLRSLERA